MRRTSFIFSAAALVAGSVQQSLAQGAQDSTSHGSSVPPANPVPTNPPPRQEPNPVRVPTLLSLTGALAFGGIGQAAVLRAVQDAVNKQGGVRGYPLQFEIYDDQTNPVVAVNLMRGFIRNGANVVLGPTLTASCLATAQQLSSGPVAYCFSPTIRPQAGSYQFAAGAETSDLCIAILRYLRARGTRRVAILASDDSYGQDGARDIESGLRAPENGSLTIVARETAILNAGLAAQAERIKAAGAQALIAWVTVPLAAATLRGLYDAALGIPVVMNNANMSEPQLSQLAGSIPPELYFPSYPFAALEGTTAMTPAQRLFSAETKAAGIRPDANSASIWDPAMIVVGALRRVGPGASAAQIRNYINGLRGYAGIAGTYDFSKANRGLSDQNVVIVRWNPGRASWLAASRPGGTPL